VDLSRPAECGYLFLVPEGMAKEENMLRMYEDCIFPALVRERESLPKVAGAAIPRILHFMDGDHGPLQGINSLMALLEQLLIDCVKSSAGTSAIEQANDVMRAFMMLRKLFKSFRYVYNEAEYQPATTLRRDRHGRDRPRERPVCGQEAHLEEVLFHVPRAHPERFSREVYHHGMAHHGPLSVLPADHPADYARILTALRPCSSGTRWTTAPFPSVSSTSTTS
jgi:hypothetical protein